MTSYNDIENPDLTPRVPGWLAAVIVILLVMILGFTL